MRNKEMYNINNLNNSIQRDNAILIKEPIKITRLGIIEFICKCGESYKKNTYNIMMISGAFCKKCTVNHANTKSKRTFLIKYGVEHVLQNKIIKEKAKLTFIKKYGVEHPLQSEELKQKSKNTTLERFGTEYASQSDKFRERVKNTCIKKYGVDNPNKVAEIREKIKNTCLEKYGVDNPAQSQEIMEKTQKNAKKYKDYTMPSGIIRKVQGYESFALDELVKIYSEDDIKTDRKDIPRIKYIINDKNKYYFPDIYIKSGNKIIEVKSTWTYKCKEDNVQEKLNATKLAGYEYEIWIYDNKGNKTILT
jgi:hypothetical protein